MRVEHAGAAGGGGAVALVLVDAGVGAMHCGVPALPPVVGKARAVACSSERTCAGVSDGLTESIRAAVPATSGAEKLVPSDGAPKLSV